MIEETETTTYRREAERVKLEVAGVTLSLHGLEESNGTEDLGERGPQQNLRHATGLHESIVSVDRGNL